MIHWKNLKNLAIRPILEQRNQRMNQRQMTREWADGIRTKYKALKDNEEHLHNNLMHEQILETWKRGSPVMWSNLSRLMLTGPLAYVVQAEMWERKKVLMQAGLPVTDAREQAEKETLMLEPEAEQQEADDPAEAENLAQEERLGL